MPKITKKEILDLCSEIDNSVEYLNHGGCGVFAFLVGSRLEKFDNCAVKVRVVDFYGEFTGNIEKAIPSDFSDIRNWEKNGVAFNHIVLEVKLKHLKPFFLDSHGIYESEKIVEGSIPVGFIQYIVQASKGWNSAFNRRQIPTIMRKVKQFFSPRGILCNDIQLKQWECKV